MDGQQYKKQAALLLSVIPEVAKEDCFALHGGTAINLFVRDMPRLSVDIDLTYVPIEDRPTSLENISSALMRIKQRIETIIPDVQVEHKTDKLKLLISAKGVSIKLEVNQIGRGTIEAPSNMTLCDKAQSEFDVFCVAPVVPLGQLYGGKICAALDRQHPRDLFDVKYLLEAEGFSDEIRAGFLLCLISHDRPISEVIRPNFLDQRQTMINHFEGMSNEPFSYEEFEAIRKQLIRTIHANLTEKDREFLLSVKNAEPDWGIYDFRRFPAVQWKLQNLRKLKNKNPEKHLSLYEVLKEKLSV
ncbi:MAG: nucleotidyl transferase AbiEii/AbiGii toxin family protein [Proteobacteria bacterium]|nr:nucleotidyl transferase AbiEii/AbiGii toxin family protein [Pseudomonadota bacterium]